MVDRTDECLAGVLGVGGHGLGPFGERLGFDQGVELVPHDTKDREHFVGELHGVFSGSVRIALQWPRQGHQAASSVFNVEVVCLSTVMSTVQGVAPA